MKVLVSSLEFSHPVLATTGDHVTAMRWVKQRVQQERLPGTAFPLAQVVHHTAVHHSTYRHTRPTHGGRWMR